VIALRRPASARVAAALVVLASLFGAQAAAASSKQVTFFEAPRDLTAAGTTQASQTAALDEIGALGVHALRVNLHWYDVAPAADQSTKPNFDASDPNAYSWGAYAQVIDDAKKRGWTVLISPSSPVPKWATAAGTDTVTRPKADEFELFGRAVAKRFGGPKVMWSIWNEPNLDVFLKPQTVGGKFVAGPIYRQLFISGRKGIQASQPGAKVLFGETAPSGLVSGRQKPIAFLRDALCISSKYKFDKSCGKLTVDGFAHHPYRSIKGIPASTDDVTYQVLPRLTRAIDKFAKAGAINAGRPVYLTEFGIQSYPDLCFGEPAQLQLEERNRAEHIAYSNPRVLGFSQYLLTDDNATGPRVWGGFETGLKYAIGGKPKLAYDGFRLVMDVTATSKKKLSIWGLVRPATGRTTVAIERRVGKKWATWKKLKTKADGSFTTTDKRRSGARYRYRWTSPTLGKLTSPGVTEYKSAKSGGSANCATR
jgi:hypothetical protein